MAMASLLSQCPLLHRLRPPPDLRAQGGRLHPGGKRGIEPGGAGAGEVLRGAVQQLEAPQQWRRVPSLILLPRGRRREAGGVGDQVLPHYLCQGPDRHRD